MKLKTHRPFYTQTLEHYTQTFLHTNAFIHLYTDTFTHIPFDTQKLLHTDPFTIALHRNTLTHRRFYIQAAKQLHTDTLLHTDAFTQRPVYAETALHTDAFTHRPFDTQTLSHTDAVRHRRFLRTDPLTHRHL